MNLCPCGARGQSATAEAQLVLYDDFASGRLDPARWWGVDSTAGAASPTVEMVRQIRFGNLEMRLNQHGLTTSDSGTSAGQVRLRAVEPGGITTWQAQVTVLSAGA